MSEQLNEDMNVPISPERLLAATMKVYGKIEIPVDDLLADYSNFQIAVDQERDGYIIFELLRLADEESE